MSSVESAWFKRFEEFYRGSAEKVEASLLAKGNERYRAYRALSALENSMARLWGIMRVVEEEEKLNGKRGKNMVR